MVAVGVTVALFVLESILARQAASARVRWVRVDVRVAGSWIAAIGLLMLGWAMHVPAEEAEQNRRHMKNMPMKGRFAYPTSCVFVAIFLGLALSRGNAARAGKRVRYRETGQRNPKPIANLISVPFQNNFNFGIGPTTPRSGS